MGKKTNRLKERLREEGGGVAADALTLILRQEEQLELMMGFASFVHGWVGSMEQAESVEVTADVLAPLKKRLHSTRNDMKRLRDPDDGGCCG